MLSREQFEAIVNTIAGAQMAFLTQMVGEPHGHVTNPITGGKVCVYGVGDSESGAMLRTYVFEDMPGEVFVRVTFPAQEMIAMTHDGIGAVEYVDPKELEALWALPDAQEPEAGS